MASITRIEVANFLSDGYSSGKEWIPLYRGETLRLFGQSAALQIDNGGGKTSLTEACLYLLSRNRQLRPRVEDRVAPVDEGWTHIRIEFVERLHNENILQSSLITVEPDEVPGTPYVIGLCWNRGKDPYFYRFQGLLEDALCFQKTKNKLELIDNESFRNAVKKIPGARWNNWGNIAEWHEDISQFTNVEIIKQNVEFQLEGAGDYSAMVTKVKPQNGEPYAVAFFRQFVAPELLRQPLGDEGEEDEQKFEDALFKTLKPTADALVDIAKQQRDLNDATEAIAKFQPVEEKAQDIIDADREYKDELAKVIRDGAIIHEIAVKHPIPGIPTVSGHPQWLKDKKVLEALSHLVIDKRYGMLITDEGLSMLIRIETKRLNEKARDKNILSIVADSQLIDFEGDLKKIRELNKPEVRSDNGLQLIENKGDLKESTRGKYRKYTITCYNLESARALVNAAANIVDVHAEGLHDILIRAFCIAQKEFDTNPYRAEKLKLTSERNQATQFNDQAKADHDWWQQKYEELLKTARETKENQIAYEAFVSRKEEFPQEHWETPLMAKKWAEQAREKAQQALSEHNEKKGKLDDGFRLWKRLKDLHDIISLPSALDDLIDTFKTVSEQDHKATESLSEARAKHNQLSEQFSQENSTLTKFQEQHQVLSRLAAFLPKFREIFGDVVPDTLNPQKSLQDDNNSLRNKNQELDEANRRKLEVDALTPNVATFQKLFGDVDPSTLNPVKALTDHNTKIAAEQHIMVEHQPYIAALNKFREAHPEQTPGERLQKIAEAHSTLGNEKTKNVERSEEFKAELADLDQYAVADDRVYASALEALHTAGISFERLHETISAAVRDDRRRQLLTLFSAALSAPVVTSIEDADNATRTLERAGLTVPVFLKPALVQFAQHGNVKLEGTLAYTFLVGRRTRQVDILLNPDLIAEEKLRIQNDIVAIGLRNDVIDNELIVQSEESKLLELATSAVKRGSEIKFNEAHICLERMSLELPEFENRASDAARKSIEAAKQYIAAGGGASYYELIEHIIPRLDREKQNIEERIETLNKQVTEEALRALFAATDYKKNGGDTELNRLSQEIKILDLQVKSLKEQLEDLGLTIRATLEVNVEKFAAELDKLKKSYYTDKQQLEAAISFENDGHVAFIQDEPVTHNGLNNDFKAAQHRLENIDFERVDSYIQMTKAEQRSPADQLAEAASNRGQAKTCMENTQKKIDNLSSQIAELDPFIEAMHDMVVVIRSQHTKIAVFSDDIRQCIQDGAVHPEIIAYAEAIRLACLGDRASTSEQMRAAIVNLKVAVEELEIDTRHLLSLDKVRQKTRAEFEQRRGDFCGKARSGEIKGLHDLEIKQIEEASTLEQLLAIHDLKDKIEVTIKQREANLQKIRELMESNKTATVDSLAHFARQAKLNLDILDKVMKRKPHARFIVKAEIASEARIRQIIESLIADIEDRESAARERSSAVLNDDIDRRNKSYKEMIHTQIYRNIFIDPQVSFIHTAIRDGETPLTEPGSKLSTGQHTALAMMWLVRQAEYAQDRVALMYGTRKEQRAAMKGAQRIMFFDGLFSNLSNESYINAAFHGLKDVGDNFQLIGLIHNPHYVNNKDIFPTHLVGKRKLAKSGDKERVFVAVEPWQEENGMIVYTSAYKHNAGGDHAEI
jgi:hypothetical protein